MKKIKNFQIISIIFVMILGMLLHFIFEWSNENVIIGAISAVNESTWEHLKLLFFPMLITTIVGYFYIGKKIPNFLCAKMLGILTAIIFTVIFFYTYTGILGQNIGVVNVLSFFIAVIVGEYVTNKISFSKLYCNKNIAIISLLVLCVCFVVFTYVTPQIGLFKDPLTGQYGINCNIK